ncbi:uncharacterized protein LOC114531276 [Dendronephthya gigantea]|uniref:uncharacterized protein LOC114531276 n=1 Tax=Dendronephthya gigantea TaxID=151771 RepID=UPI00106D51BF|nr:uncharacterized protein LOC114531276 [Dendronephthya gigantea]
MADGELSSGSDADTEDEQSLIEYYFSRGFKYKSIIDFLHKRHGIVISERTLRNRLSEYGLRRRSPNFNINDVRRVMSDLLNGPGKMGGYRSMWHALRTQGLQVQRRVVEHLMRELDPEGCQYRRAKRLRRRTYHVPGPNYCWHSDGYDKLKPYGFPIHGCIDGWSRKIIWLHVARSNNKPEIPASFFLRSVQIYGCPVKLRTDCGTENGTMAAMQCHFRSQADAHFFGTSPANQRIECWWSYLRKNRSTWWINYFKDLCERNIFNPDNELESECLWLCFSDVIQKDLDYVKEQWNTHRIRNSRHDTIAGIPDELYYFPEKSGGEENLAMPVADDHIRFVEENLVHFDEEENITKQYFEHIFENSGLHQPTNWQEAEQLYITLMAVANGT